MKTIKYQVRWDCAVNEDGETAICHSESDWFLGVNAAEGWRAAQAFKRDLTLQEDEFFDLGIDILNVRIVRVTEEVVE